MYLSVSNDFIIEEARRFKNYSEGGKDESSKKHWSYCRIIYCRRTLGLSGAFRRCVCTGYTRPDK
jgi:hypothetical protein